METSQKKEVGGQAIIEGVMFLCEDKVNFSVRKNKKIVNKTKKIKKGRLSKILFLRGIINLFLMLKIGIDALMWSAEQQIPSSKKNEKISKKEMFFSLSLSLVFAILMFIILPFYAAKIFYKDYNVLFNLIDGIIRIFVFVLYVYIISFMKEVKTLFQYHGAEHKVINCYESGKQLNLGNIHSFSTHHPRCGTSFIIFVLVISILVFSLITLPQWYYKLLFRIILIPVIVGISYEILKLSAKIKNKTIFKIINYPGLLIQKITTNEPNNKQIEVALHSLRKVLQE